MHAKCLVHCFAYIESTQYTLVILMMIDLIQTHAFKYHLYADGSKIYIFSADPVPELPSSLDSHLHWDI